MTKNFCPGKVLKEERRLKENLKFIDLVLEVVDARLPLAGRNNRLKRMLGGKKIITILNKSDLADKEITGRWLSILAGDKGPVLAFDAKKMGGVKKLENLLLANRPQSIKYRRPLRLIVVGIPNTGKSTIINRLAGKFALRTGEKPGITRGPQWLRLRAGWEMLDTPGLLPPSLKGKRAESVFGLAAIGSLDVDAYDEEDVVLWLLERYLSAEKTRCYLFECYSLENGGALDMSGDLLYAIGARRGCLIKGGQVDKKKTARIVLRDFRKGTLGRISLEKPEDYNGTLFEG